ncbi:MAG: hypothetical protein Q4B58_01035, partial [Bacteroidales bacterium]|nr:hypothetical protein [Bacteroidales bacterium]
QVVEDMVSGRYQEGQYRFFEASSIRKIKDKYVFIYSRWAQNGEWGLPETNYTLAYAWSNNPLGPWTYGGTIIDGRGREQKADGSWQITATPTGNTHGSICEINGQWWVFYHRQAGTCEFSRQAMVAPIEVDVKEGADGYVKISEGEFTSEGFETEGLNPLERHAAGIACYMVGPEPAHQEYPNVIYPGSHTGIFRIDYDGKTPVYDPSIDRCHMVNNVDGSAVGYKYFNFSKTADEKIITLAMTYIPEGVDGVMEVWLDRPTAEEGGRPIGALILSANMPQEQRTDYIDVELAGVEGKHALFFVFKSDEKKQSMCQLCEFKFVPVTENISHWNTTTIVSVIGCLLGLAFLFFYLKPKQKK